MHLFNRVKFRTPESVELEFTLAGIGNRAWALIIDYHILAFILVLIYVIFGVILVQLADFWLTVFGSNLALWMIAIVFILTFAIYTGYFVFFETLWQGQTLGKRFAKIRVIRDDGRPIGLQQAALRGLLRPLDEFLFIGAFLIMLGNHEKRLGDFAASTIVIQDQIPIGSATLNISDQAKLLYEELMQIADLSALLPDDFAVIREYLQRRNGMSPRAKSSLSLKLSQQVQAIINLEQIPVSVAPDVFLEAIYLAYKQTEF
ncbi:RDD family protein [Tolypothrix sp. FACHB-123]|uniref:RDD family protein n=1 Tax=Tolypothrix sp. FACHB-123 TaxID=2692868 RepID=UPI001683953B|nr:RDD family protein [Tolypothrix sp. FACHB-123]MBD2358420.1 RDD family protein [Tolypothrix sp. FACHB-123]